MYVVTFHPGNGYTTVLGCFGTEAAAIAYCNHCPVYLLESFAEVNKWEGPSSLFVHRKTWKFDEGLALAEDKYVALTTEDYLGGFTSHELEAGTEAA